MDHPTRLQAVLTAIVAVQLLAGGIFAYRRLDASPQFVADAFARTSSDLPLTIERAYPTALEIASDWSDNAQLLAVNMQIDWPLSVNPVAPIALAPGGWISYTFFRSSDDGDASASLSLFFERTSGVLVQERVVDWSGTLAPTPLEPQSLAVSSTGAIMTTEARAGLEWRATCPVSRHVTRISLTANVNASPTWVVTYADSTIDRAGILAHIDAERGEITRFDVRTEPCAIS